MEGRYLAVTDMRACNAYASACHAQLRLIGDPHGGRRTLAMELPERSVLRLLGECIEIRLAVEQVDEWLQNFLKLAPGHCEEPRIDDALWRVFTHHRSMTGT